MTSRILKMLYKIHLFQNKNNKQKKKKCMFQYRIFLYNICFLILYFCILELTFYWDVL